MVMTDDEVPIKSENDKKEYRLLRLDNGLTALLISDPTDKSAEDDDADGHTSATESASGEEEEGSEDEEADAEEESAPASTNKQKMSAAALCVAVGSFSDPEEVPGLAHFVEHMVFMGSHKYPEENALDAFVSRHGGSTNAFTDCERTVFKMEVHPKHLEEALDRFAQFFVAPLMKPDAMAREVKAVDSEFRLNLPDDTCRRALIFGSLAKEGHPMAKFMWGDARSLDLASHPDLHEQVKAFRERYYSAHLMTLAVQSRDPLDALEEVVRKTFSDVPNNGLSRPEFHHLSDPFELHRFNKLLKVAPVKQMHKVVVSWMLPCLLHRYEAKPLDYIGWIMGHEGSGSLFVYLQKKGWALRLSAGNEASGFSHNTSCATFEVSITLTDAGMDCIEQVLESLFSYLSMLRTEGPQRRIFDEICQIEENSFRFLEEEDPEDYVEEVAEHMQLYPPKHYLCGNRLFFEYDEALLCDCLDFLVPKEANIILVSSRFQGDALGTCLQERWTGARYSIEDIPEAWMQAWCNPEPNPAFHLPHENKFIPTDFSLKDPDEPLTPHPVKIFEDDRSRLFYKQDTVFSVPKACVYLHLVTPEVSRSAHAAVCADLFCSLLHQHLAEAAYDATVASLSYSIYAGARGIVIKVSGFNDTLPSLLDLILENIVAFEAEGPLFEGMKRQLCRAYFNQFQKNKKLANEVRLSILERPYFISTERHAALKDIDANEVNAFLDNCLTEAFLECLVQGNLTATEAQELLEQSVSKLGFAPLAKDLIPRPMAARIPTGTHIVRVAGFEPKEIHSAIVDYYQLGLTDTSEQCLAELMAHFMAEPCFDILRTREQLGYDVSCQYRVTRGIVGFTVTVMSPADAHSCSQVDRSIENFLSECAAQKVVGCGEEEFLAHVASLVKVKACTDLSLKEEADRNWGEVLDAEYCFGRLQREIAFLQGLDRGQFQGWCARQLQVPSERRKLSLQVVGRGEKALQECKEWVADKSVAPIPEPGCQEQSEEDRVTRTYCLKILTPAEAMDENCSSVTDLEAFKEGLQVLPPVEVVV